MIKGKTVTLVILDHRHLELLRQLRNNPDTNVFLTSILPINDVAQEEWFRKTCLDQTKMYFAIELQGGEFAGVVRCDEWDKINRSIRIGVDIVPAHRRKGLATDAYGALIRYLFEQMGMHRIWLLVADFNKPAIALYRKLGFVVEGAQRDAIYRNNRFHDYVMMSLLSGKRDAPRPRRSKT